LQAFHSVQTRFKEKTVAMSVLEEASWLNIKKQMEKKLKIDAPGGGISFIIPLSSIGGKKTLQFLIERPDYQKEEESTLKNTDHELIVTIAEHGYSEMIMNADYYDKSRNRYKSKGNHLLSSSYRYSRS